MTAVPNIADQRRRPDSTTEPLRLEIAHYRRALERLSVFANNSLRNTSTDHEDWRADMAQLAGMIDRELQG